MKTNGLTLADIRKPVRKVIKKVEGKTCELIATAKPDKTFEQKVVPTVGDYARHYARQESENFARQLKTDIVITGGNTKTINDTQTLKSSLDVCGEWAPWSPIYKLSKK